METQLLLSAGKLSGKVVLPVRQPYGIERFGGVERLLADLCRKLDVFERSQILHEIVELKHKSYIIAAVVGKLSFPVGADLGSVEVYLTLVAVVPFRRAY